MIHNFRNATQDGKHLQDSKFASVINNKNKYFLWTFTRYTLNNF